MNRQRTERINVMLEPDEVELIDAWRYEHHIPSRSAAVRELIRRGLQAGSPDDRHDHHTKSKDYGLRSKPSPKITLLVAAEFST